MVERPSNDPILRIWQGVPERWARLRAKRNNFPLKQSEVKS